MSRCKTSVLTRLLSSHRRPDQRAPGESFRVCIKRRGRVCRVPIGERLSACSRRTAECGEQGCSTRPGRWAARVGGRGGREFPSVLGKTSFAVLYGEIRRSQLGNVRAHLAAILRNPLNKAHSPWPSSSSKATSRRGHLALKLSFYEVARRALRSRINNSLCQLRWLCHDCDAAEHAGR